MIAVSLLVAFLLICRGNQCGERKTDSKAERRYVRCQYSRWRPRKAREAITAMTLQLRAGSWQNGFFEDFYFWDAGFFRTFVAGFCLLIFVGKKCPEKSSRKIPGKILQKFYNRNPRHISAEGPGQEINLQRGPWAKKSIAMKEIYDVHCCDLRCSGVVR